jgi:galactosylceramidase
VRPFPLPFAADFEEQSVGAPGRYFSDQHGTFEVVNRSDGKGKCLKQTVTRQGICWASYPNPRTVVGDIGWEDYRLSVDLMLPRGGKAMVWGRVCHFGYPFSVYGAVTADE